MWIFEEPLFGNITITSQVLSFASLRVRLKEAGLVKLGHLMKTSVPHLADLLCIKSTRVLLRLVKEVCASLPAGLRAFAENRTLSDQWDDECEYVFSLPGCVSSCGTMAARGERPAESEDPRVHRL